MITNDKIKKAYLKLLSSVYYDNTNLKMRKQMADYAEKYDSSGDLLFEDVLDFFNKKDENKLKKWLDCCALELYPKKISKKDSEDQSSGNFLSNKSYLGEVKVNRLSIFASFPIEIHLIAVLWLMEFGPKIEAQLDKCCYGNRLALDGENEDHISEGRWLYKRYIGQYQKWWGDGISIANRTLKEEKEDVAVISMDLCDYYHSVRFDFEDLRKSINVEDQNFLWRALVLIHEQYWSIVKKTKYTIYRDMSECGPLPIGLLSSPVLANWYLKDLDIQIKKDYKPLYYGRYVDDMMFVIKNTAGSETKQNIVDVVNQHLPDFVERKEDESAVSFKNSKLKCLENLKVQPEKLFVYEFDKKIPSVVLEKFYEDQKQKSSEFRFYLDDDDEQYSPLESVRLIDTFETKDEGKSRFKEVENNRFLLSKYFYKFTRKLVQEEKGAEDKELESVLSFFVGDKILDYYIFWERIITLFVVAGDIRRCDSFIRNVQNEIELISDLDETVSDISTIRENAKKSLKENLYDYLVEAKTLAFSLNLSVGTTISNRYVKSHMVRRKFNNWPLQELMPAFVNKGIAMNQTDLSLPGFVSDVSRETNVVLPYYVKLYEIMLAMSLCHENEVLDIDKAMDVYCKINGQELMNLTIRKNFGEYDLYEVKAESQERVSRKDKVAISMVEMSVSKHILEEVLSRTALSIEKRKKMYRVLDGISRISSTDVFILPELALPIELLKEYCQYSAKRQVAFISGLEYWKNEGRIYNQIITCLPFRIGYVQDCIPIIRTKNHYAPEEIVAINSHRLNPPDLKNKTQYLFHWGGHTFASYYCYELASIKERSIFFSKVDAIYASVFNRDTSYFNNIVESMVRDMHCFFVLCNVSDYGDSRVTRPTKRYKMDKLKVKGGNTFANDVVVLSDELEIKDLRDHQALSIPGQKDNKKFKTTPPGYNIEDLNKRVKGEYLLEYKES